MAGRGSRYESSRPFVPGAAGTPPFPGTRPREIGPALGVLEHVVKDGERLDLLAYDYYHDTRLWWRILDANPEILSGASLSLAEFVGSIVLIPKSKE